MGRQVSISGMSFYSIPSIISGTDRAEARDGASAELRRVADEGTKEESRRIRK